MLKKHLIASSAMFGLLALLLPASVVAKELAACQAQTDVDRWCSLALVQLRPTQLAVGMLRVEDEVAKLGHKDNRSLQKYAKKKQIPVIIGPDGGFYLADRHHLSRVLFDLGLERVPVKIIARLDNPATFWAEMRKNNWAYPFDERGRAIDPSALPRTLAQLKNDPYRSLAAYAQEHGAYDKADQAYFIEFAWAKYFANAMQWRAITRKNLPNAIDEAIQLACKPAAQALPGYKNHCQ